MKNKQGWIKIVEAFTSILLIAGALLIIINSLGLQVPDSSVFVYDSEYAILREIQLNNDLRNDIIAVPVGNLPIEWDDFNGPPNNLDDVKDKIETRAPGYLKCEAQLCEIQDDCVINLVPDDKDVFVQSSFFGANQNLYAPRKLNLFCWAQG
ncbi:hypothetical protein HYT25_02330 [Candidatus Pacearchaeota archaeon]|nr:hypothetical protein [Candidatus Pacearchaeota archaeon]